MAKTKHLSLLLFSLIIIIGISLLLSSTTLETRSSSSSSYLGAAECGRSGCHAEQYVSWNQTAHAQMAGYLGDLYGNGTIYYWVHNSSDPSRIYTEDNFIAGCAKCHTTGWDADTKTWPEKSTDPGKFLNVQCEVCHGPGTDEPYGTASMILNYSSTLCGQCHRQPADLQLSAHNDSLTGLLASDHARDSCLVCHSTQAFLGEDVSLTTEGLEPIACALCHEPHSEEYKHQLRFENSTELCGQCHSGSHNPQYELFTGSPHEEAEAECASCHGQGRRLYHGEEEPWFNHTFWIYNTFYPYSQTKPMVCSNCHAGDSFDWAVSQLEVIQSSTPDLITTVTQLIGEANTTVTVANQTSGVNKTKIDEALALIEAAENYVMYVENDGSDGFHNPQALSEATQLATEAKSMAISAMTTANLETQISTLQADIENLEERIDNLESTVATVPYLYAGMGLAIGFIVGTAIVFVVRRGKP